MKQLGIWSLGILLASSAWAKIPAPVLNDEAKAKAAEAAAKTVHVNKVANFRLCQSMDKAAVHYFKTAKAAGKDPKPALPTPTCEDPGMFVYNPTAATPVATGAAPTPTPAATAPAAAASAKKS